MVLPRKGLNCYSRVFRHHTFIMAVSVCCTVLYLNLTDGFIPSFLCYCHWTKLLTRETVPLTTHSRSSTVPGSADFLLRRNTIQDSRVKTGLARVVTESDDRFHSFILSPLSLETFDRSHCRWTKLLTRETVPLAAHSRNSIVAGSVDFVLRRNTIQDSRVKTGLARVVPELDERFC